MQAVLRYLSGAASLQHEAGSRAAAAGPNPSTTNGTAASVAGSYAGAQMHTCQYGLAAGACECASPTCCAVPCEGARLLAFLAGPPNAGRGRAFHRRPRRRDPEAAGPTASTIIMDPMMSDLNPYTFSMPAVPPPSRLADAEDDGPQPVSRSVSVPYLCRGKSAGLHQGPARDPHGVATGVCGGLSAFGPGTDVQYAQQSVRGSWNTKAVLACDPAD